MRRPLVTASALPGGALLTGCSSHAPGARKPPAVVENMPGAALPRIVLTSEAVQRLGVTTQPVAGTGGESSVPFSAVVYDVQGRAWVFVSTGIGTYQRAALDIDRIDGPTVLLRGGTDLLHARQLTQERLDTVAHSLPTWASTPVMLPPVSATGRVLQIGMWSGSQSLEQLSAIAYWTVRARLLRVPGVSNVAIWNERQPTLQVQVDPGRMKANGVALENVMTTTSNALDSGLLRFSTGAVVGSGGFVDGPTQRLALGHTPAVSTPEDLAHVPLEGVTGPARTLGDVADVVLDHQPLIGDAVINGGPGLLLVVERLPWANTLQVTKGVDDALRELGPGLTGIHFDPTIFRASTFIDDSIHNLSFALLLGFLLVTVILVGFLYEWRVALISLITIPLSLVAALLVLRLLGGTVNTMTLAGLIIALGAIVDDAIIDVENILRRLRQDRAEQRGTPMGRVILEASLEVRGPIVYATLIIVVAVVPVFLLHGLTAAFFQPLVLAYTLALLASMAVALTVTPALTLLLLRKASLRREASPLVRVLQRWYAAALTRILHRPRRAYLGAAAVALVGVAIVPQLGQSLFPAFKERDLLIHWDAVPGTSAPEMERTTLRVSQDLRAIPGVRNFGSHIGRARQGEEVVGINAGENWISIAPSADYEKTLARIRTVVDSYPGLYRDTLTYLNERIAEVLTGSKESVVIRVFGQDLPTLRERADQVQQTISGVGGVVDQHVDLQADVPQIQVQVDLAKAAAYGLKPGDVRRAAATMVAGEEVGDIFRGGKVYGVAVWSTPQTRAGVAAIADLPLDTPDGNRVRLGDLATVTVQPNPNVVTRDHGARYLDVAANVHGRDLGSAVSEIRQRLKSVAFPQGYHYELLGEYLERQNAQRSLLATGMLAAAAILLLLQAAFGSWRLASFVFLTLPVALVGGALAIFLAGGVVSIGALVGFFTVFGIAARNGILLINHCQYLETEEGERFGPGLVLRGARERLSPILMTSLATGLALVPLVVLGGRPGHEIEYPLAVVILGGLGTSVLLSLFVVPSLYLRLGRRRAAAPSAG